VAQSGGGGGGYSEDDAEEFFHLGGETFEVEREDLYPPISTFWWMPFHSASRIFKATVVRQVVESKSDE
jgi:hypothetical protein